MASIDAMKILGSLLSSGALSRGSGSNILGSVIGAVTGGSGQSSGGGLGGLVGSMLGGSGGRQAQGGLGDLLGSLLGGAGGQQAASGGLGDLIGMAMNQFGAAQQGNTQQARNEMRNEMPRGTDFQRMEDQATILIKAMINAAKSDGRVDREEQDKIVGRLGNEVTPDEVDFVRGEMAATLDVQSFARSVPRGLEHQVYAMSLTAIDLDTNKEAQYLHQLAQAMGITPETCNQIHQQLGAPQLYT